MRIHITAHLCKFQKVFQTAWPPSPFPLIFAFPENCGTAVDHTQVEKTIIYTLLDSQVLRQKVHLEHDNNGGDYGDHDAESYKKEPT